MKFSATTFLLFLSSVESKVASNRRNTFSGVKDTQYIESDAVAVDEIPLLKSKSRSIDNDYDDYFDADNLLLSRTVGGSIDDNEENDNEERTKFQINKEAEIKMKAVKAETRMKMNALKEEAKIKMEAIEKKENIKMTEEEDEMTKVYQDETSDHEYSLDDEEELDDLDKEILEEDNEEMMMRNSQTNFVDGLDDLDKEILEEDSYNESGETDAEYFSANGEDEDYEEYDEEKSINREFSFNGEEEDKILDDLDKKLEFAEQENEESDEVSSEEYYFVEDEVENNILPYYENYEDESNTMINSRTQNDNMIPYSDYELVADKEEEIIPAFFAEEEGLEEDTDIEGKDGKDYFNENSNQFYATNEVNSDVMEGVPEAEEDFLRYKEDYIDDEENEMVPKTYYFGNNIMSRFSSGAKPLNNAEEANSSDTDMVSSKTSSDESFDNGMNSNNMMTMEEMLMEESDIDENDKMTANVPDNPDNTFGKATTNIMDRDDSSMEDYFQLVGDDVEYDEEEDNDEEEEFTGLDEEEDFDGLDVEIKLDEAEEREQSLNAAMDHENENEFVEFDDDDDNNELFVDEFDLDLEDEEVNARAFSGIKKNVDDKNGISMDVTSRSGGNASSGGNNDGTDTFLIKIFAALTVMFSLVLIFVLYIRKTNSRQSHLDLPDIFAPTGVLLKDDTLNRDTMVV